MAAVLPIPALDGVTHRDVDVGGVRIHVAEAGQGPPLLLQHGWPQNWWAWRELIARLAGSHRVICPDLRGFGWSEAPATGYDKETLAADIVGVLDALEVEQVGLVGHDWGGFAGFLACLNAPQRFSGYVALSILHPWSAGPPDPRRLTRIWYQFVLASPVLGRTLLGQPEVAARFIERAGAGAWDADAQALYARALQRPGTARATVQIYRTFLTRELVPISRGRYGGRRLTVPTRLLIGERDPVITPESIAGWEGKAEDMAVEWLPGAGHWLPEERPAQVAERIVALLG
jgi:pimeloyl-ACP methyl ester carboxylesterase